MRPAVLELRRATRTLLATPSYALPLAGTVALGAAVLTTTFAVAYGLLWRPLPFPGEDRLVRLYNRYGKDAAKAVSLSPPDVADRAASRSFSATGAWSKTTAVLSGGEPVRVVAARVTDGFFRTLGVAPALGRLTGGPDSVVLSFKAWRARFGGEAGILGKTVVVDGEPRVVTAVLRRDFAFPSADVELFVPLDLPPDAFADDARGNEYLEMIARLAPGATVEGSQAEMDVLSRSLLDRVPSRRQFLVDSGWTVVVRGLREDLVAGVRPALVLLLLAAGLVSAIGAVNATALVLARVAARQRDAAVRAALGAGAARAVAPRVAEAVTAVLAGGLLSAALTAVLVSAVVTSGIDIGRPDAVRFDGPAAAFLAAFVAGTALLCGAAAAVRPRFLGSVPGRYASAGLARFRSSLVVAEVALATALLVAGALVVESLRRLSAENPGFRAADAMTFRIAAPRSVEDDPVRRAALFSEIQARVARDPRVAAVSAVTILPLSSDENTRTFSIEGRPPAPGVPGPSCRFQRPLPGFLPALRVPLVAGRMLDERDVAAAPRVAVVDEAAAARYFPGEDPVGRRITFTRADAPDRAWREIVGVIGSIRHTDLGEAPMPHLYVPALQAPPPAMTFVVRSDRPLASLVPAIREAVRSVDPTLPIDRVEPLESFVAASLARPRFTSAVLGGFALVALLQTAVGLYGLLAFLVTTRQRELAIRMAVGAEPAALRRHVLRSGLRLAAAGVALGLVGALAASGALRSVLYSVAATDLRAHALVAALLLAVAALASWAPARRASRVEPAIALRAE